MYRAVLLRGEPSMVHSSSISKRYRESFMLSATVVGIFFPVYSRTNSPFLISHCAKSPCPIPGFDRRISKRASIAFMEAKYNTEHDQTRKTLYRKLQGCARFLPRRPVYPTLFV